jgi:hypothetical protein
MRAVYRKCTAGALAVGMIAIFFLAARAQEPYQFESDLVGRRRLYPDVGAGFRQIRRRPNGTYYLLTAPAAAVSIYDASGKRIGQIPNASAAAAKGAAIVYGESFDVDRDGRVAVCDRGANAVKVYSSSGALSASIPRLWRPRRHL